MVVRVIVASFEFDVFYFASCVVVIVSISVVMVVTSSDFATWMVVDISLMKNFDLDKVESK